MARVDHNEPHATLARLDDCGRMGEPRETRIVAPKDQAAALANFRHGAAKAAAHADAAHAEGVTGGKGTTPTAEVETVERIRTAKRVHQPLHEAIGIGERGGGRR